MAILQSNMGEEITNGASEVLKELYGVLELMTVYMLRLGILGWYIYFKDNSKLD